MNRIEFYNRVDRFKEKLAEEEELKHAGVDRSNDVKTTYSFSKGTTRSNGSFKQKYYNKIDNYYNDGSARYFYSKDEWDAYVKAKEISKKNDSGREAAMKKSYNAEQQRKEEATKRNEEATKRVKEEKAQEENYRKNMEAAQNAERNRYMNTPKETTPKKPTNWQEAKEQSYKEQKEAEAQAEAKKAELSTKTREQAEKEAQQREFERQNSQPASPEAKRIIQLEDELTKLKGKLNLAKNKEKMKPDVKNRNDIERLEKEIASKEESMKNLQKQISKKNDSGREAAIRKSREVEQQRRDDAVNKWKKDAANDADAKLKEIDELAKKLANTDGEYPNARFNIDNEIVDLLKEELSNIDPDFDGDLTDYLKFNGTETVISKVTGFGDDSVQHVQNFYQALKNTGDELVKEIDKRDYDTIQYGSYLDGIKARQNESKAKAINKDINEARINIDKIYKGENVNFKFDKSLLKVLNEKLEDMDDSYGGNITAYVRPYLFGIKDDVSYQNVKKALDEIEKELKAADKNNDSYGKYIQKVSKVLT